MFCPRCGTENEEDADYCTKCGTPLKESVSVPVSRRLRADECFGGSSEALPSLVIGVIIIIMGITSLLGRSIINLIGSWGETFGEGMGRWGESVGRFFAKWGTSWGSTIGAFIAIFIGLSILLSILNRQDRW